MRGVLFTLVLIVTLTALPAGLLMILEPGGSLVGLPIQLLSDTPFTDFFIPGLVLALIVGGCSMISLFLIIAQNQWSYKMAMAAGIVLLFWLGGELVWISSYHWLQGLYLAIAILIILTSYQLMGKAAF